MLGMHPPFFQGVLVPLNMTNPVRFMTNPCLTNPLFKNKMTNSCFRNYKEHTQQNNRETTQHKYNKTPIKPPSSNPSPSPLPLGSSLPP